MIYFTDINNEYLNFNMVNVCRYPKSISVNKNLNNKSTFFYYCVNSKNINSPGPGENPTFCILSSSLENLIKPFSGAYRGGG